MNQLSIKILRISMSYYLINESLNSPLEIYIMQKNNPEVRPLLYSNKPSKADIHSFVHGNPSQAISINITPSYPAPHYGTSLFDRYNRSNLYLRDCDERDLLPLSKNLVIHQQHLSGELADCIARVSDSQKAKNIKFKPSPSAVQPEKPVNQTTSPLAASREYIQNQILFSYNEMAELKKKQKQDYLTAIEVKVKEAEQQIKELQNIQSEEREQMGKIGQQQQNISSQLNANLKMGYIQQSMAYVNPISSSKEQPLSINQEMSNHQINEILEEHFKLNEDILDRANRARYGQTKPEFSTSMQGQKLGATMKKAMGGQKSLVSTTKEGFKGKKKGRK